MFEENNPRESVDRDIEQAESEREDAEKQDLADSEETNAGEEQEEQLGPVDEEVSPEQEGLNL